VACVQHLVSGMYSSYMHLLTILSSINLETGNMMNCSPPLIKDVVTCVTCQIVLGYLLSPNVRRVKSRRNILMCCSILSSLSHLGIVTLIH